MKVTVSVRGKFHAFELAAQLQRHRHLGRLITSYPAFALDAYGIPRELVTALPVHEVASRLWGRAPRPLQRSLNAQYLFHDSFDRRACRHILSGTDVYVGWSGFSERGLRRAQALGAVTVLERGSAHIESQRDLLQEEYERWCLTPRLPHSAVVEKEKREYELADYIYVPSSFARQTFLERGFPPERVLALRLGVNARRFRPREREDEVFRVVHAGAMTLQKGVQYLIQAFAELKLRNAELWLVGARSPEMDGIFRRYNGWFRHFDSVPESRLPDLYARCSVFALCSIHDGFGMVLTQAMATGLPVIATDHTGGPDIVRHETDGFIIPIRDVAALKQRILSLYENRDLCRSMGERARQSASQFTWDDYGTSVITAYRSALARKRLTQADAAPEEGATSAAPGGAQ